MKKKFSPNFVWGFSLMEMMIVMLIMTIILAAAAPIISKRSKISKSSGSKEITHGQQMFKSSGTFTVPNGVTQVWVTMTGGGGASGYDNIKSMALGGGGAGSYTRKLVNVTSGASIPVSVGFAGLPCANICGGACSNGVAYYSSGGAGGSSSFGNYLTATGGLGGSYDCNFTSSPGSGGTGDIPGGTGGKTTGGVLFVDGGYSAFGKGAMGQPGAGYGAGGGTGGGTYLNGSSAVQTYAGSPGFVLVEW